MKWFVIYEYCKDPGMYDSEICDNLELINLLSNRLINVIQIVRCPV